MVNQFFFGYFGTQKINLKKKKPNPDKHFKTRKKIKDKPYFVNVKQIKKINARRGKNYQEKGIKTDRHKHDIFIHEINCLFWMVIVFRTFRLKLFVVGKNWEGVLGGVEGYNKKERVQGSPINYK